ncbi:MAG: hypothetical protein EOP83_31905 [Verrucomicrobiaceae bacterium]|nr:MAG: hypothetical protein EOP83_31905 [Verrucomicrobiaceae bacterium]
MSVFFPTRALILLLAIGLLDLAVTAGLSAKGLIEERNPLMAPVLAHSEWSFVGVKLVTLVSAYLLLVRHSRVDQRAVKRACLWGSGAYLTLLGMGLSF